MSHLDPFYQHREDVRYEVAMEPRDVELMCWAARERCDCMRKGQKGIWDPLEREYCALYFKLFESRLLGKYSASRGIPLWHPTQPSKIQ